MVRAEWSSARIHIYDSLHLEQYCIARHLSESQIIHYLTTYLIQEGLRDLL